MNSRSNHNQDADPFFPLVFAVADFTQQLSAIHERHADDLQILVEAFRKRNADLRKERSSFPSALFTLWELLLQEVEVDSQIHGDVSRCLSRNLGTGLKEKTFHRKIQSRKVFIHRASLDALLTRAEDLLKKTQSDYVAAYDNFCVEQTESNLINYYDAHNNYVHQLHAFNGMLKLYIGEVLPNIYEEIQEAYLDVSDILACSIQSAAEFLTNKIREQSNHYQAISSAAKSVTNGRNDLVPYIKGLNVDKSSMPSRMHTFVSPALINDTTIASSFPPEVASVLTNELYIDKSCRYVFRSKLDELKSELNNLDGKIQQLEEAIESLLKLQQRSLDSNLHNKANEIQEEICLKKFDLHVAHMHMAAIKSQIELYTAKEREFHGDNGFLVSRERKSSTTSTTSIKMKWFKAFKSLKSTPNNNERNSDDKRSSRNSDSNPSLYLYDGVQHVWTEYTYKKITPCDICHEVLRGHSRQGMKCKMCKLNAHSECTDKATKCQQPKTKLLRRQKSTSEIEAKLVYNEMDDEKSITQQSQQQQPSIDPIYQLLRTANEVRRNPSSMSDLNHGINDSQVTVTQPTVAHDRFSNLVSSLMPPHHARIRTSTSSSNSSSSSHLLAVNTNSMHASCSAPHSPQRKKLSLRMKSFSLDESTQHVQRARPPNSNHTSCTIFHQFYSEPFDSSSSASSDRITSNTGSPRKPTFGKIRMNSVDLPNTNADASASPSPCPSPQQSFNKKPQRLLPTNLYVALYNFRGRHEDELDLKAGTTLTVTDTTDPDWWQGKTHGQVGLFPSKYVAKLYSGERPLQMLHTIQVSDGEGSMVKLLRDQIIIQVGEELDGIVMIRTGMSDKAISCPAKYVAEV
ncbi:uncharacterized protein LOC128390796 isoform X2 [Panonychus citri]|uniref:uncharacterized protein LOC128390796 isoform X2 n=1 Tax=Panonychus citri TaxID=50023 RepID=UPI0023071389|nr:uncharacterized protein LOC128390796 isoform X2 [Panonychus citri]